jgi:two-component system, chemotaxis family, chemotaxis protein CheY
MKSLIVDDNFTCRKILLKLLSEYGHCDIAVNGKEAIEAFLVAWDDWDAYDLICLDIMMPEMNGQEVLKQIRKIEKERGKYDLDGVKILMTTALDDSENIKTAFREQCEAYLVKPIAKQKLIQKLTELELIKSKEINCA